MVHDDKGFLHTENFVLVDGQGYIRGVYNGARAMDVQRLIEDLRTLLIEKAATPRGMQYRLG